jgi:adenosylhomocysteine nucleosidase
MICIIGAIKEEVSGIKQRITIKEKKHIGAATFYKGLIKSKEILIVRSGVGQSPAQRAASDAVNRFKLKSIISIGFTGGVVPELIISDLILPEKIYCCEDEESLFRFKKVSLSLVANLSDYRDRIKKILTENKTKFKTGNIISVNRVADSVKFKEWLGKNYPVSGVEMETASIAKIAARNDVPFFSLRAVSDEVSHAIFQTNKLTNKKGKINRLAAGYYVLTHPFLIPRVIELKKNAYKAAKTLTDAVLKIINSNDI